MLKLGVARVDITPDWSLPLAGFAARQGPSQGVAQPLHLRVAVFETDEPAGGTRALVASADLLKWPPERVPAWREAIAERIGIPPGNIMLAATHTHSGPQTTGRFAPSLGELDPRFQPFLEARLLEAVAAAASDLEPVEIWRGHGEHRLGVNRRMVIDGVVHHAPNPAGPVDPELTIIEFRTADDRPKAFFVHYTCHPVISMDNLISSEFPGVAMSEIGRQTGAVALYLQGCAGDINPATIRDGEFIRAGDDEVVRRGKDLAAAALQVLSGPLTKLSPAPLRPETVTVELPFERLPTQDELEAASRQPGVLGEWGRALLAEPERIRPAAELSLQRLDLSDGLGLLAMDGEMVVAYGLATREHSGERVLPVSYSNGAIGYVPTATQLAEGGYEADESTRYLLLPGRFSPVIEERVRQAIARVVAPV